MNYLRYLPHLPKIPQCLIDQLPKHLVEYDYHFSIGVFKSSRTHLDQIKEWCDSNIFEDPHWNFQFIAGNLSAHFDTFNTTTKLVYLFEPGGKNVRTQFFLKNLQQPARDYCIEPFVWHLLKVDVLHSVVNEIGRAHV